VNALLRDRPRPGWRDRLILPAGTPIAPRGRPRHVAQRRPSRLDHLRPHRLDWDALTHPERRAVRPGLGARGGRPAAALAGAA
jgi:hypothetical protein